MNNGERYRAAFSHVHAPAGTAGRAMAQIGREAEEKKPGRRFRLLRPALVLAGIAALLTVTVGAELSRGTVSNLLAPLYGGTQTQLVNDIGRPLDASVSHGGYTLTADAVIGDRYQIAIVYTLTRDDGSPIPENAMFADFDNSLARSSGGGYLSYQRSEELPVNQLQIVQQWTGSAVLLRRNAHVIFRDLCISGGEEEENTLLAEGLWELNLTIRYQDSSVSVPTDGATVTGLEGGDYQLKKVILSPVGLHIEMTGPSGDILRHRDSFQVSLRMADGTVEALTDGVNFGGSGEMGEDTMDLRYGVFFPSPIPLEEIDAVVICGTEFRQS